MKKLITLSAIAIIGFSSCKKEIMTKEVTFNVECSKCNFSINNGQSVVIIGSFEKTINMNINDQVISNAMTVVGNTDDVNITSSISIEGKKIKTASDTNKFVQIKFVSMIK